MKAKSSRLIVLLLTLLSYLWPTAAFAEPNSRERPVWKSYDLTVPQVERGAKTSHANAATIAAVKCPSLYTVRYGDSLASIAARCGVSVASIKQANRLKDTRVWPGQRLVIPTPPVKPAPPSKPKPPIHPTPAP